MPHTATTPMFATTDLCDAHEERLIAGELRVLHPAFRAFGKRARFAGPVATVRCFEDNSMVRAALETPGKGRVLVVDGGGSLRCALLGDMLATQARDQGWSGVIVFGCVRDSAILATLDLGVMALAATPRRSQRRGEGQLDVPIDLAGTRCASGDLVHADDDGIVLLHP